VISQSNYRLDLISEPQKAAITYNNTKIPVFMYQEFFVPSAGTKDNV